MLAIFNWFEIFIYYVYARSGKVIEMAALTLPAKSALRAGRKCILNPLNECK